MIDGYVMSDETLRTHMHLMHTLLDIIELCLSYHSGLAKTVVQMTTDSIVMMAEEMQESVDRR